MLGYGTTSRPHRRPGTRAFPFAVVLALGVVALPFVAPEPAFSGPIQPPNLDHFLCYSINVTGPIAEQVPFGLTPAGVELRDQFGRLRVQPRTPDRLCNPVNKILPNGQGFPPANVNAHLVCDPIEPPGMAVRKVRLRNQFGEGRLNASPRQRLCLPSWKQDVQNPNAPGSVAVPRPAGTPVQPPGLDHFECYELKPTGTAPQFQNKPPFVTLVDQFGTRQVNVGNAVELCNPVNKIVSANQQFPPQNPQAHLVCFEIANPGDRAVRLQNQFGTGAAVAVQAVRLCLPSFKRIVKPPPPDFNGNGTTDIAVFRPSTGFWFISGGGTFSFGTSGDAPVAADYDGDGDDDIAVFRPSTGTWFVMGGAVTAFGAMGDLPVPADYDGDGDDDIAVFRPSTGGWFLSGIGVAPWGTSGDIPVPGDYDGDGDDDIAVFRPSTGTWFVMGGAVTAFGAPGDIPVPSDYDGDGDTDIAVFRPSTGGWFVSGGGFTAWGTSGDIPVPGDYDGDLDSEPAVFRPSTGVWFVSGGPIVAFGTGGDRPLPLPSAIRTFFFP